jgi:hypothetical protein
MGEFGILDFLLLQKLEQHLNGRDPALTAQHTDTSDDTSAPASNGRRRKKTIPVLRLFGFQIERRFTAVNDERAIFRHHKLAREQFGFLKRLGFATALHTRQFVRL